MRFDEAAKRTLDLAVAAPALVVALPAMLAVAVAIRSQLGRPVLFRQQRPGLGGPFVLVKFRTMLLPEQAGGSTVDALRMTPLGSFLRATSIDELPSLWNVVRGDMSLVGPRPLLMRYLPRYSTEQARRHEVRPGLTGWAQVNGRNALDWQERFRLDVEYVDNHSLRGDLKILALTVRSVLRRDGIHAEGQATMREFMNPEIDSEAPA